MCPRIGVQMANVRLLSRAAVRTTTDRVDLTVTAAKSSPEVARVSFCHLSEESPLSETTTFEVSEPSELHKLADALKRAADHMDACIKYETYRRRYNG